MDDTAAMRIRHRLTDLVELREQLAAAVPDILALAEQLGSPVCVVAG